MITKPTVFILGAGASKSYGYPLGHELLKNITDLTLREGHNDILDSLVKAYQPTTFIKFGEDLRASRVNSIDTFLGSSKRTDLERELGKFLITLLLLKSSNLEEKNSDDDWFKYLWNKMITPRPEDIVKNNVSFITFNYDISLENILYSSIKAYYNLDEMESKKLFNKIPIIHLHGKISTPFWIQKFQAGQFLGENHIKEISTISNGIKIIHEADGLSEEFTRAKLLLTEAETIHFMGFGYHYDNLHRLGVEDFGEGKLFGSSFGLTEKEMREINQSTFDRLKLSQNHCHTNLNYLRNHVSLN